ncbi:MAG TPA: hypothetical protein DCK98_10650 [Chloroflexi bacterium]|jgi:hypothetical protein|nr:hypothetical protein [Chloroflexota bacterium]HAL26284.1 hypothetical protein [Chloroflexota bacterium]
MRRVAVAIAAALFLAACSTTQAPPTRSLESAATAKPAASAAAAVASTAPTASVQPMEVVGKFALEPARGPWDTKVTATVTGMKPSTKYDLVWTTGKVQWKLSDDRSKFLGRSASLIQNVLQSPTTDANGGFQATFSVPRGFGYAHDVMVVDAQSIIRNKSLFDVDMVTTISPTSGPLGTPITVEVKGIGWQSYQNSFQLSWDNAYTGWVSSITTDGYAKFVIPATGRPGAHYITLGHSEFGAPYLNPQQQPVVASRPFPHLPFTITDGPAVLPEPVEQQGFAIIGAKPVDKGIWTSPGGAIVGTPATLNAKALPANSDIEIGWTTMVGNRSVTGFEERTKALGTTRTDGNGAFTWAFKVPDDLGGDHVLSAKIGDTVVAKTNLYILANAFPLSVDRGPAGTKVSVHLKGVGWTETEQIYHLVYDNAFAGYSCAFQSAGDIEILLTVAGEPGWHFIDMYPGIYQGSETRPANYKMPQLTALDDHPGNRLPIFRFAFLVQ